MAKQSLVDILVPDEAYDPTGWDGDLSVPTKNAVRDAIEGLNVPAGSDTQVQFNDGGTLGGDDSLTFDSTAKRLKVYDSTWTNPLGTVENRLSVGSTTTQTLGSGNEFIGLDLYAKVETTGTPTFLFGQRNELALTGEPGTTLIVGNSTKVVSVAGWNPSAAFSAIGSDSGVDIGSGASGITNAWGSNSTAQVGSVNVASVTSLVGARGAAIFGYAADVVTATGVLGVVVGNSDFSGTVDYVKILHATSLGSVIDVTDWAGLYIGNYTTPSTPPVNNYGIFIDDTIDHGTNQWAIVSESSAPSVFAGTVSVPDDPYDATDWNGNLDVPTKNAIRDKIESIVPAALTTGSVLFAGASGEIAQDNAKLFWNDTDNYLMVGHTTRAYVGSNIEINNEGASVISTVSYANSNVLKGLHTFSARGTRGTPLACNANDIIGQIAANGHNSSAFSTRSEIRFVAAENWDTSVSGTFIALRMTNVGTNTTNEYYRFYTDHMRVGSGVQIGWSSSAAFLTNANDTGLARNAAGVVRVTDGSSGYGNLLVEDEAYDATSWNGSQEVPTKNAIRDKIESMSAGSGITRTVVVTSGSATMGSSATTDYVYFVAGAHTMSLPAASGNTNRYTVKNNHSANITIDTAGAENIEGAASISLTPESSVDIVSDGTNWFVI